MPFIGQQPITGAYHKLDSITTSATATYNLQLNGGAYYPTSANHLLVSLNGVMQAPQDSFTVSGSQITFASALTSSDSIDFIMALGDVLDIGVPSDGTVNTSQLANSAVTDAKIASGITASKLTGALPAIDGSSLTGIDQTMTLLSEVNITNTQEMIFDMQPDTYIMNRFVIISARPTLDNRGLWMRFGRSASDIEVGAYYDTYNVFGGVANGNPVAYMEIVDSVGNDVDETVNATVDTYMGDNTYHGPYMWAMGVRHNTTTNPQFHTNFGYMAGAFTDTYTHCSFLWENASTNPFQALGKIYQYGLRRT